MSDTTRNPDDAVERGTVATGDEPGAPGSYANAAAAAEPAAAAAGNGSGNGADGPGARPDTGATGGAHAAGEASAPGPAGGGAHADAASPVAREGAAGATGPKGQAADDGPAAPSGAARPGTRGPVRDAPPAAPPQPSPPQPSPPRGPAQVEPPAPAGPGQFTPPRGASSVLGSTGRPAPAPRPDHPESAGDRVAGPPAPAPGPVPGPGPGAAPPPPWRRMPGGEQGEHVRPDATGLLDEGPTAFMEPPRDVAGSPRPSAGRTGESGWSMRGMRAMRNRPPRQAALQLKRLDPWSVLKLALVLAVVLFLIWLVAVGILYGVLDGMGVWDRLNGTYADLVSGQQDSGSPLISAGRVFAVAAIVGAINSLLFAVAVTLAAFIYNVSADLVGGVEVTLSERD